MTIVLLSFLAGSRANGQEVELAPSENGLQLAHTRESLTVLSLEGSELKPELPVAGGKNETPQYVRELIQLKWRPNDPIDLFVIRPAKVKNPPVVVYLYSFPATPIASKTTVFVGVLC